MQANINQNNGLLCDTAPTLERKYLQRTKKKMQTQTAFSQQRNERKKNGVKTSDSQWVRVK